MKKNKKTFFDEMKKVHFPCSFVLDASASKISIQVQKIS